MRSQEEAVLHRHGLINLNLVLSTNCTTKYISKQSSGELVSRIMLMYQVEFLRGTDLVNICIHGCMIH